MVTQHSRTHAGSIFLYDACRNKVVRNGFHHQHLQICGGVRNRWSMQTITDPFLERALILQVITPCAKKVVWLCETKCESGTTADSDL